jgi:hypothetical protein
MNHHSLNAAPDFSAAYPDKDRKLTPVEEQVLDLVQALNDQGALLAVLEQRLTSVLTPGFWDSKPSSPIPQPVPMGCELVEQLRDRVGKVRAANEALSRLMANLEL